MCHGSACQRKRWIESRRITDSATVRQVAALSDKIKAYMLEYVKRQGVKVFHEGAGLRGYTPIDGIVKIDGQPMLLAVFPEEHHDMSIHAQMWLSVQLSKAGSKLTSAMVYTLDKNEIVSSVVELDEYAAHIELDEYEVIMADDMPPVVESTECETCKHRNLCSGDDLPLINCNTCAAKGLPICQRCTKYELHIFHPQWLQNAGYEIQSVDGENLVVEYDGFYSCNNKSLRMNDKTKPVLLSSEIKTLWKNKLMADDALNGLIARFSAELIDVKEE